ERAASQWTAFVFGERIRWPELEFDLDQQQAELAGLAGEIDRAPVDARAEIARNGDSFTVEIIPEQPGLQLSVEASAARVREALAQGKLGPVDLVTQVEPAALPSSAFRQPKADAERMLSAPVTLTLDDKKWTLGRDEI